jgi:hypothetical protein
VSATGPPGGCDVEVSDDVRNSFDGWRAGTFGVGRRRQYKIADPAEFSISRWSGNHVSMELYLPRQQIVCIQLRNSRQGNSLNNLLGDNTRREQPEELRNILLLLDRDDSIQ